MILSEVYIADETAKKETTRPVEAEEVKTVSEKLHTRGQSDTVQEKVASQGIEEKDLNLLIPETLGTVVVKRGDSLLVMLEKVYGHSRPKYRKPVVEANQHISNINSLEIGDKINFPTIIFEPSKKEAKNVWVKIKSTETLDDAVNFVRNWSDRELRLKIIPYYLSGSGLNFDIVFKKLYPTKEDADNFISNLSPSITEVPEIIEFQLNKSVFFADPYAM